MTIYCKDKKIVKASSLEQAKEMVESDRNIEIHHIKKIVEHCNVDEILLLRYNNAELDAKKLIESKKLVS